MPIRNAEQSPTKAWSLHIGTRSFSFWRSVMTTICQGCRLAPEGAVRAISRKEKLDPWKAAQALLDQQ